VGVVKNRSSGEGSVEVKGTWRVCNLRLLGSLVGSSRGGEKEEEADTSLSKDCGIHGTRESEISWGEGRVARTFPWCFN